MPNNHIFNNFTEPLAIADPALQASLDGSFFAVSTGPVPVVANGFLVIQLNVPANARRSVYIARVSGGATVNTTIDLLFNATFAAAGTALTPTNGNLGSTRTSITTAKFITQATDPTSGGTRLNSIIQTGGAVGIELEGRFIIPSNGSTRTFYVRLTNNTNQTNLLSVNISYWEAPTG